MLKSKLFYFILSYIGIRRKCGRIKQMSGKISCCKFQPEFWDSLIFHQTLDQSPSKFAPHKVLRKCVHIFSYLNNISYISVSNYVTNKNQRNIFYFLDVFRFLSVCIYLLFMHKTVICIIFFTCY